MNKFDGSIIYTKSHIDINNLTIQAIDNFNTLWKTDNEVCLFYVPSGGSTANGVPVEGANVWFGLCYGLWNLPIQIAIGLVGVYYRSGYINSNTQEKAWNPWRQIQMN